MTSAAVAKLISLTPAAVRRLAKVGQLRPTFVTTTGQRLFSRASVDDLIARRRAAFSK